MTLQANKLSDRSKRRLAWSFLLAVLLFIALFAGRFIAGYFMNLDNMICPPSAYEYDYCASRSAGDVSYQKAVNSNFDDQAFDQMLAGNPNKIQKLEVFTREATLCNRSKQFNKDEQAARNVIADAKATIRIENCNGIEPNRSLSLVIKVPESNFDTLITQLKSIGDLDSFDLVKEDQSEQAKALFAQFKALESYRAALAKLRSQKGSVENFAVLEEKILAVEQQLQKIKVDLGTMVQSEPFNNICFTLSEYQPFEPYSLNLMDRFEDALVFSCLFYIPCLIVLIAVILSCLSISFLRSPKEK